MNVTLVIFSISPFTLPLNQFLNLLLTINVPLADSEHRHRLSEGQAHGGTAVPQGPIPPRFLHKEKDMVQLEDTVNVNVKTNRKVSSPDRYNMEQNIISCHSGNRNNNLKGET